MKETKLVDGKCLQIDKKITHVDQRPKSKRAKSQKREKVKDRCRAPNRYPAANLLPAIGLIIAVVVRDIDIEIEMPVTVGAKMMTLLISSVGYTATCACTHLLLVIGRNYPGTLCRALRRSLDNNNFGPQLRGQRLQHMLIRNFATTIFIQCHITECLEPHEAPGECHKLIGG